jgi:hypothetical protein
LRGFAGADCRSGKNPIEINAGDVFEVNGKMRPTRMEFENGLG